MQGIFESIDKMDVRFFLTVMVLFWIAWGILFRGIDRRKADRWSDVEIKKLVTMSRKPLKINKLKFK